MSSDNLVNKGISMCFVKMAKVDGDFVDEEKYNITKSQVYNKYKYSNLKDLNTEGFFQKFHSTYGPEISKSLDEEEKENLIRDLIQVIKADGKIHKHESFLLGHIGNCIGLSPEKIVNIIKSETKGDEKSDSWLSWLFG